MTKKSTKQLIRILLLAGAVCSLYFVPWPLINAWIRPLPKTVQEQVNKATDYGFDGIIVYVDKKGEKPEFYTAGYKNRENQIPADPQALFKIASVGKLYYALAIAKLVSEGQLVLDKTLADYLPEVKGRIEYADKITLKMMAQHRSGIPNFTDTKNYWLTPKETTDENLALVLDLPANFKPGDDYEYSNTNYLLLDRIMSRVLGHDTFLYIREAILNPLDLEHTFGSIHEVNINDVMSGYYVGYDKDLKTNDVGSMLATAEDVGNFIRALNDGTAFTDKKEQEIYTSLYEFEHTGLIPGYQTIAKYDRECDMVVIQFTNTVDFEGYNWGLSEIMVGRILKIIRNNNRPPFTKKDKGNGIEI